MSERGFKNSPELNFFKTHFFAYYGINTKPKFYFNIDFYREFLFLYKIFLPIQKLAKIR